MFKIKFDEQVKEKIKQSLGILEEDPYDFVLCAHAEDMEDDKINLVFSLSQLSQIEAQLQFFHHVKRVQLSGKTSKGDVKIRLDDILYIESFGNDIEAFTFKESIALPNKLYQLVEELEPFGFIRVGKSCIVNIAKVHGIKPHFNGKLTLTLENEQELEVNRTYVQPFKQYLKK